MKIEEKNAMGHRDPEWFDTRVMPNAKDGHTKKPIVIFSCKTEEDRRGFLKGLKSLMEKHTVEPFELSTRINSVNKDLANE